MVMDNYPIKSIFLLTLVMGFSFSITSTYAQNESSISYFPSNEKPFGLSYEDHITNYWKWILSIPVEQNPMMDRTGEQCTFLQNLSSSSIFYLSANGGGKSERTCTIPAGLGILIPIIDVEASEAEKPGATLQELHQIAKNDQDHVTSLYLKINDVEFDESELRKHRFHTNDFEVLFPENALFGANPGVSSAVADGFYIVTKPLAVGNYTIDFKGGLSCFGVECLEANFATENLNHLIVK